jgi:hypothetical protein
LEALEGALENNKGATQKARRFGGGLLQN